MRASPSQYFLILQLAGHATANSAATCVTPISARFATHPECAQSCLGCLDSNESFAHACDIDSDCCQGPTARLFIPLVYGCVSTTCSSTEAQESWEEFLDNCGQRGFSVGERDTPSGYSFVSGGPGGDATRTTRTVATGTTSLPIGGHASTAFTSSPPARNSGSAATPPAQQPVSDGASPSGLGTGEIVGIALGAVSALAAVIGLGLRWKHLQLAKKNAAAATEAKI